MGAEDRLSEVDTGNAHAIVAVVLLKMLQSVSSSGRGSNVALRAI